VPENVVRIMMAMFVVEFDIDGDGTITTEVRN
jgi:hypothetical protein